MGFRRNWYVPFHLMFLETMMKKYYNNKVVLITGGSSGIGAGFALKLAQYNAKIAICARSESNLKSIAEKCTQMGAKDVFYTVCDVTNPDDCKKLIENVISKFGQLDVLILNAGISGSIQFDKMKDLSIFDKMLSVNFKGYVNVFFHALPHLKKSQGRVGVVSSMSGKHGIPLRSAYCAAKFAVNGFFEVVRSELVVSDPEMKISILCPGWVDTQIRERHVVESQQKYDTESMLSVDECVGKSLLAISTGKREERFSGIQLYSPLIAAIVPEYIDRVTREKVYGAPKSKL
jgi:short-subunit dehydrogenase